MKTLKNTYVYMCKAFSFSVWSSPKCFSLEISCPLSLTSSSDLNRFNANNWSFSPRLDFLETLTV